MHSRPLDTLGAPRERSLHRSARLRTLNAVPRRHTHLPLLSALVSLLSIDDETFHLVTHSPAHSALFPGPIYPSDEQIEDAQEIHGVHALLSQHGALRQHGLRLTLACSALWHPCVLVSGTQPLIPIHPTHSFELTAEQPSAFHHTAGCDHGLSNTLALPILTWLQIRRFMQRPWGHQTKRWGSRSQKD